MDLITGSYRHVQKVGETPFLLLSLLLLLLIPLSCAKTRVDIWEGFTISGKTLDVKGNPVTDVYVYAYEDERTGTLGPADAMSEPTGGDGVYTLILPEGKYALIARRRQSGSISGPLKNGDMYGKLPKTINADSRDRPGTDITMKYFRHGLEGNPEHLMTADTRIMGTVVDPDGMVLSGINIIAYRGSIRQDPPDIVGPVTDSKGRFAISLPGGGEYTIVARTGLGERPGPGDSIGFWGDRAVPTEVYEGTVIDGVKIVVRPYKEIEN
jgi:hypothetical protein